MYKNPECYWRYCRNKRTRPENVLRLSSVVVTGETAMTWSGNLEDHGGQGHLSVSLFFPYPTIIRTVSHLPCSRIPVSDWEHNGRRKQNWPHVVQFFSNYQKDQPLISWLVHSLLILQRKDVSFITKDKHNPSITDWMAQFLVNTDLPIKFPYKNKSTALTRINPCANIHVSLPYD